MRYHTSENLNPLDVTEFWMLYCTIEHLRVFLIQNLEAFRSDLDNKDEYFLYKEVSENIFQY